MPYFREWFPPLNKHFPPLNSFRSLVKTSFHYIRGKLLRQLFEILYTLEIQKIIVSAEIIRENTVFIFVHLEKKPLQMTRFFSFHFKDDEIQIGKTAQFELLDSFDITIYCL